MIRPTLAMLAALAVVGCSGGSSSSYKPVPAPKIEPASVQSGQEQSLFPFKVGNSWTYNTRSVVRGTRSGQQTMDATFKVTKVEDVNGTQRATLDLVVNGKIADRQIWHSNSKGIYQVSIGLPKTRLFSTPIPAIVFPVEKDKKFSWNGFDSKSKMAYNCIILGPQEVDTDEKRMSAIAVEAKGTSVAGNVTERTERTMWFAPGIGLVRIRESTAGPKSASELTMSLKSHVVK